MILKNKLRDSKYSDISIHLYAKPTGISEYIDLQICERIEFGDCSSKNFKIIF